MSAKKVGPPLHRQITRVSKVNISFNIYFDVICVYRSLISWFLYYVVFGNFRISKKYVKKNCQRQILERFKKLLPDKFFGQIFIHIKSLKIVTVIRILKFYVEIIATLVFYTQASIWHIFSIFVLSDTLNYILYFKNLKDKCFIYSKNFCNLILIL